jgi:hypothetical protein
MMTAQRLLLDITTDIFPASPTVEWLATVLTPVC